LAAEGDSAGRDGFSEMKKIVFCVCLLIACSADAAFGQPAEDIQRHPTCKYCGMNRQQYAHSRGFTEYDDGTTFGSCSLHCTAIDLILNLDKVPVLILVGDYDTKELIDAESAWWVIGGSKPGVMTKRAKWAFKNKRDAEKFVKSNGGEFATFEEALKATYQDMYTDSSMIRNKRKIRRMHK